MSIRRKNGRPYVEVYDPATRKKRYVKPSEFGMNLRNLQGKALERAAEKLNHLATEAYERRGVGGDETCDQFAARWPDDFPRGETTAVWHRERLSKFIEDFRGRPLRSITRQEARTWAAENKGRVANVRTMFSDAVAEGLADQNVFARLGQPKTKGRQGIVVLTREEVDELVEVARRMGGQEFAALVTWAAYTCMRPGEIFDARYSLLNGDTYDLRSQFNSALRRVTEPKHGSVGEIFVPEPAQKAVLALPRRLGDDLMFRTRRGRQYRQGSLLYAWEPVRSAFVAGLPATHHLRRREDNLDFYELRHFGASYMLNVLELEPWVVAEQLRHSDGGTLVMRLYGHPDRRVAINRIRRAYGENASPSQVGSGKVLGKVAGDAR